MRQDSGEYIYKALKDLCEWKGIQIQYTSPYIPQQNGHAERLIRTIYVKKIELYSLKVISQKKCGTKQYRQRTPIEQIVYDDFQ